MPLGSASPWITMPLKVHRVGELLDLDAPGGAEHVARLLGLRLARVPVLSHQLLRERDGLGDVRVALARS